MAAAALLALDRGHVLGADARRRVEAGAALAVVREHPVGHQYVVMHVAVERIAEPVHERHRPVP